MKFCRKSGYANRGMGLESDINLTNEYYIKEKKAYIYKKPTPIKISKVDYSRSKIVEAFFDTQSTLDYNGLYKGKYIDFEAKETISKTSFPLSNIHEHQIKHIKKVIEHQGIAFIIVRFSHLNLTYLLFGEDLISFLANNTRKSIPLDFFKEKAYLIKDKLAPRIDYLEVIDMYGGNYEKN